ncbi:hypothetical protein ACFROC_09435 [Nocardia tengchongensis]|uniref:hypothetical protein n=1 Tax=Nocardia tengchongensis TaxID=2055889 RepID=UPI0036AB85D7
MDTPPSQPTDDDYWKPQAPGATPPPPPEYLQGSGEYIPQFDYPEQPVRPAPPAPRYQPYAHIPASPPPEGKGLAITALIFAVLSLGVPCLFGWAGIFLGLTAAKKGHPLGKVAIWTSIVCMFIGFVLAALANKYLL